MLRWILRNILNWALPALLAGSAFGFEQGTELPRPDTQGALVQAERYTLKPVTFDEGTRVFVFFYSASWCAPCKQIGKKLSETYPDFKTQAPQLEFVTYSLDFTPRARADYLRETRYPWPAIAPAALDEAPWKLKLEGGTPQFQAFAMINEKLVSLTEPGKAAPVIEAALAYLQKLENTEN